MNSFRDYAILCGRATRMFREINNQERRNNPDATAALPLEEESQLVKIYLASLLERSPVSLSFGIFERELDRYFQDKKEKDNG